MHLCRCFQSWSCSRRWRRCWDYGCDSNGGCTWGILQRSRSRFRTNRSRSFFHQWTCRTRFVGDFRSIRWHYSRLLHDRIGNLDRSRSCHWRTSLEDRQLWRGCTHCKGIWICTSWELGIHVLNHCTLALRFLHHGWLVLLRWKSLGISLPQEWKDQKNR